MEIGELPVIQTHQVQNGGVQIGDVNRFLDGLEPEFIGRAPMA